MIDILILTDRYSRIFRVLTQGVEWPWGTAGITLAAESTLTLAISSRSVGMEIFNSAMEVAEKITLVDERDSLMLL